MKRKTGNTIFKVVVVLIVTLGALGAITYFSYQSYHDFTSAVDKLYNPADQKNRLTENILADVSEMDSRSRSYALTLNQEDLKAYILQVEQLRGEIDSLYLRSFGTNYHDEADTLRDLFQKKVQNFQNLIRLKISQSERAQDKSALLVLAQTQNQILEDSMLVPKREVTTTTITSTDPDQEESGGFFKKIFSKKENAPVKKEMLQERTVAYDSAYFEKVDTLISSVEQALRRAEYQRRRESQAVASQELQMLANEQRIVDKLREIALKIKQLEGEEIRAEKQATVATARDSFSSVIIWAICGGILSIILIYFVISDIWRNRRMQIELSAAKSEAERLAQVKEEFLANMSHEIRTPLNAIIGFSEQMTNDGMDDHQKLRLNNVRSSSEHLLMLVNDILDYSKIESGKLRLEEIGFRLKPVIKESLATLDHIARNKGIELRHDIAPELEQLILSGDPIRLKQILINLAGNGVKFTDHGYVKISAWVTSREGDKVQVQFEVEDTGKGIANTKLEEIFEGFSQEDSSINRRYGGTGLGLTISKKLVQLQEGSISVKSEEGEGSTFTVMLSYRISEKENYTGKFDPERVEINLKGRSLLLIDDDRMNHVLLKPSFERWGLKFESAYDGVEGIRMASENFYNYVLVDLQMPGKNGLDVVRALRAEDSASASSTLILCTANAMVRQATPELLKHVDASLLKPFKEYEVAALLADFAPPVQVDREPSPKLAEKYSLDNFNAFAGNDAETLRQFISSFIETNQEHLRLLRKYFEAKDYTNVGDTAHKMKNTFGQLKATEVLPHLLELEKLTNTNASRKVVQEHIDKTQELAQEIFTALEQETHALDTRNQMFSP